MAEPQHKAHVSAPPAPETHAAPADHARQHQHRDAIARRLARAEGHLAAVRRMVLEGRDCPDILIQLAAVRAALEATAKLVLADHLQSCLQDVASGQENGRPEQAAQAWEDLRRALESFIR
jgi:DNA-binding FrmR family transcriptional regulator